MDQLSEQHLRVLMKLMRHAKYCFEAIADNDVISHVYHAKQLVPFKTMNVMTTTEQMSLKYNGALAFWLQHLPAVSYRCQFHDEHRTDSLKGEGQV